MGFPVLLLLVWAIAMAAWFLVSKYVKSADMDRIKSRLSGTTKAKVKKGKAAAAGEPAVIQKEAVVKNRFAQLLVDKLQLGPKIGGLIEQAGLTWQPARFVHLTLMSFIAGFAIGWLMLPVARPLAVATGLLAGSGPFVYVYLKRRSRLRRFEELFPDTLEFVSRSMRAGHAFSVSLEMIHREFQEPVASEFRRTFEEHNLGLPIEVALQKLAKRVPSLDVHFFVSAVLLQKRTGGNLAEILDKLAYVMRERVKLRGRIRAVSAHGRMTATALTCIPIAVAILMFYTNPDYVKFFFTDDTGNLMMGAAAGLQVIGYLIMKKIVNIEV
ncbi:MAG TPA: type II secretion system F family protein [Bryobacteraceae bacterium]|nr:type II secretion system F family protein [Bryobacteraceae bacterium]